MAKKKVSKASAFRKKYNKAAMVKRTKEAYESRESSGKFDDYFNDNVPLTKKRLKNGDHILDVVPYLAGENNPNVPIGEPTYKLDIWVHQNIGPKENSYVCPARNYDKPCPICDEVTRLRKEEDMNDGVDNSEIIKKLNPKRRCAYNIVCYDSAKEEEEGVVLFEVSHYLFETELNAVSKNKRTGGFVPFSDPDEGKTIEFTKEGEKRSTKYKGFQLTDREEAIPDEFLDNAICIEDYITILPYAELAKIAGLKIRKNDENPEDDNGDDGYDDDYDDDVDDSNFADSDNEEDFEEEPEEEDFEEEPEEEDFEEEPEEEEPEEKPKDKKRRSRLKKSSQKPSEPEETSKTVSTTRRRRR